MTRTVLILGLRGVIVDDVVQRLNRPDLVVHGGTGIDDLRAIFAANRVDHVIMGAGLELDTRLAIVRETFTLSDTTTVHMKDRASGPEGFLPFVRAVLTGLLV
jgi:NAD(P)H-flavin reductase